MEKPHIEIKTNLTDETIKKVFRSKNKVKTYPIDPIECNPKILDKERR